MKQSTLTWIATWLRAWAVFVFSLSGSVMGRETVYLCYDFSPGDPPKLMRKECKRIQKEVPFNRRARAQKKNPRCQPPDFCYQLCTPKGYTTSRFFCMPTFGNRRNNYKTPFICLYLIRLPTGDSRGFVCIRAIFSAVNARVTHWIHSLFHILTSFVHIGPINLLTNRPCHGPWTSLGDFRDGHVSSADRDMPTVYLDVFLIACPDWVRLFRGCTRMWETNRGASGYTVGISQFPIGATKRTQPGTVWPCRSCMN